MPETDYERLDRLFTQLNELTVASVVLFQITEEQESECRWNGNYLACKNMVENGTGSFKAQVEAEYADDLSELEDE